MKISNLLIFALCLVVFFQAALAQSPDAAALKKTEMKKLTSLAGNWEGSGWIQKGPERETFTGSENVKWKVDGLALLVEGRFSNPEGKVIHETLAVLSYDQAAKTYSFDTFLANGLSGQYIFKTIGNNFEWGFQIPAGTIRYTINTENDTWSEIGEFSQDGRTWVKNFEMKLKRLR